MPTIAITVPPSFEATTVTVWVCSICGRNAQMQEPAAVLRSPDFLAEILRWRLVPATDPEHGDDVVCDRCIPIVDAQEPTE